MKKNKKSIKKPESRQMIKELSEADGLAGFEGPVADVYTKYLSPLVELKTDYMGNIIGAIEGSSSHPRVMLCAHLDEVGLLVKSVADDGRVKFIPHGSWWETIMLQKPVIINSRKGRIPGIMSSTSSFFLKGDELKKFADRETMFIDVGARNRKEAEEDFLIRPGDPVLFEVQFREMANPEIFMGKAFDDRLGLGAIIEIIYELQGKKHPSTVLPVATVQEEVGCRGARAATNFAAPDIAIILEGPPADDAPMKKDEAQCIPGKGPHIRRIEPGMISNGVLFNFIVDTAKKLNIPHQPAISNMGATDGMVIHRAHLGIPSIMLGIPVRYAHGHYGIFYMEDYRNTVKLITEVLMGLGPEVWEEIKRNPYG